MNAVTDEQAKIAIGENIRRILDERGQNTHWLQKQLGISPGALYPIVRGERCPTIGTASRIATALGTSIDELIFGKRKKSRLSA